MSHLRFAALAILLTVPATNAMAQFDTVLNVPPDAAPTSIPSSTQLNLNDGGVLPNNFMAGVNPEVNTNVQVNIAGGTVGNGFRANGGSEINVSGGQVGNYFARLDSVTNVTGGVFDGAINARVDSVMNIRGGAFADGFTTDAGARVNIFGGEMRLDGELIDGLVLIGDSVPFDLLNNSVLSGVLADGTPFALSRRELDVFQPGTITLHRTSLPSITPEPIFASSDDIPLGIRAGESLLVDAGGVVGDHFNAGRGSNVVVDGGSIGANFESSGDVTINAGSIGVRFDALPGSFVTINDGSLGNFAQAYEDSTFDIAGGSTGGFFEALPGSTINVTGGTLGSQSDVASGAVVNLSGGVIGQQVDANSGSVVNVTGGRVRPNFDANSGSTINISGGVVEGEFEAFSQSTVNISGGRFLDGFMALTGSNINITGRSFLLDGAPIPGLTGGVPFELTDRNVTLSGVLADGEEFDFVLNFGLLNGQDLFQTQANLNLHLLPDANFDGSTFVDDDDLAHWEAAFRGIGDADADFDGDSDGNDFLWWQRQHGETTAASAAVASVPEPATLLIAAAFSLAGFARRLA